MSPLFVLFLLTGIVWVSIYLEERLAVARALGSVLLAIVISAIAANLGFLPSQSAAYDALGGIGVNIGIALILLGVDFRSVVKAGPGMLVAFGLGVVGTAAGALVATYFLHDAVGPETWKLAGQYTGTYTGGGVNMVAVGRALDTSPELFSAAVAADNVTTTIWMIVCFGAPAFLAPLWRGVGTRHKTPLEPSPKEGIPATSSPFMSSLRAVTAKDLAALAAISLGAVWLSGVLAEWLPQLPEVLWLTVMVLVLAQLPQIRNIAGGPVLGAGILQLFLAGLGAQSIIAQIVRVGLPVFYFTVIVVAMHGLLLFGVGRLLRIDLGTLTVASQANVGGPASAMALATARGYPDKLLPGVAVGLLGYAVGNFVGFGIAGLARAWLG